MHTLSTHPLFFINFILQVHGVLNIIGWGTLLPIGAIIARFFRKFPFQSEVWWFHTHVGCQFAGFAIGGVGWGIGLWLAHSSPRYIFLTHHVFAIFIFVFAALQVTPSSLLHPYLRTYITPYFKSDFEIKKTTFY